MSVPWVRQRAKSPDGIKPTGDPHLGNYIGAIVPALELADTYESVYVIADYHALTTIRDRELLRHYTRSVAATWLAAGLDPDRTTFYRQSDVPEIFEASWTACWLMVLTRHASRPGRCWNG